MAPTVTSPGTGGRSPSRPPRAGAAEASAPRSSSTASTGDASGGASESSLTPTGTALTPTLGAAPRSAAYAPEATPGVSSADSQSLSSVSGSGASGGGTGAAADAPVKGRGLARCPWGIPLLLFPMGKHRGHHHRWCRSHGPAGARVHPEHFLALARLVVDLNRRPPLRTDFELDQRLEAAGSLSDLDHADAARQLVATNIALEQISEAAAVFEQRCCRLDKSLADTYKLIRQDRENFKAGITTYATQLRQLRRYLEQSERHSSVSGGTGSASTSTMPAAFATFLEALGALQLVIPAPPATSGSS
ncbi:unnamed protein product [Phytophthora fragariaefolia]|uniref:Unnamed protein product n=1 Tax=Phytophthora fragariaefolia TaxID=1490495 RepID=A0A9W6TK68_9STRA|nr:unnamed protein product [Phytophthora fragariaefolia]